MHDIDVEWRRKLPMEPVRLAITLMIVFVGLSPLTTRAADASCMKVHAGVTEAQKRAWGSSINRQLNGRLVDINQAFSQSGWVIVFVDAREADPPFLFFHGDPAKTRFVTTWSGAAMRSERDAMKAWVLKNAPGIPAQLAACFAWHVTLGQNSGANLGH